MAQTLGELGEFGLIAAVTSRLPTSPSVLVGPGDDAAVLRADDARVVATKDVLVEGVHFRRDWSSAVDVGTKAAAASLADVAAMGAVPTALLVGLAAPGDLPVEWAHGLSEGIRSECERVGAAVAGGDTVRSPVLMVSVTALGDLQGREPVLRSGARVGDVVALAGRLGWSAAGLAVLTRGFRSPRVLVDAHRRPAPPYDAGPQAAELGATAMCDVSDGLVQDLGHVAEASGVTIDVVSKALDVAAPLRDVAAAVRADPLAWVLGGGEDHALVATFPPGTAIPPQWRVIGEVRDGDGDVVVDGAPYDGERGWDAFRGT
ncbi:MAG: thiamine-phosphate kinase [Actinomycetota bacterium]|nr:thiamine-phosphate kinase [Actinomycetota bacterium]